MELGKAIAIFKNLYSEKYSDDEKAEAIRRVIDMETHNSITKAEMLYALNWLWEVCYHKAFNEM